MVRCNLFAKESAEVTVGTLQAEIVAGKANELKFNLIPPM